jgi:glycosyltransferase involved in cell wall biosynthesis
MNEMRHKGIRGRLRRWLANDPSKESLARQILYLRELPLGRRIKGRLIVGAKILLRQWEIGQRPEFTKPSSSSQFDAEFEAILERIASGAEFHGSELLPYLCAAGTSERSTANYRLAEAYLEIDTPERLRQALVFAERAWFLSKFSLEMFPLYERLLRTIGDAEGLREAYKRLGIAAAREGAFARAINYFNAWHYGYQTVEHVDRFAYDDDILHAVFKMAAPYRFAPSLSAVKAGERIRIAHLVRGILEPNSNLVRISHEFARHHDKSRFDVCFFVPETDAEIDASKQGRDFMRTFAELGYGVSTAAGAGSQEEALLGIARKINGFEPHLMLTSAALADFSHAFLTALQPAPFTVGLVQGPPPQFAPPWLDWCISWSKHPLLDTPVDCSHVEIKLNWATHEEVKPPSNADLNLPADAFVMMSAGRPAKFQDTDVWQMIGNILDHHPGAHFLAVGPTAQEVPPLDSLMSAAAQARVQCLGWRLDVHSLIAAADVVLDTYPNGGGQVLVEAMTLGVPIVAQRNDYMIRFDQNAWSPVEDFIDDPHLLVARGDFAQFARVVERLVVDEEFRQNAAVRCKAAVAGSSPESAVRNCEKVIEGLIKSR